MNKIIKIFMFGLVLLGLSFGVLAQTVTIYRSGAALSPTYSTVSAAVAASINGDSLVLSGHTFYEHDIFTNNRIILQGVLNGTVIDAQKRGRCITLGNKSKAYAITFQNGYSNSNGGCMVGLGELEIVNVVVQNGFANGYTIPSVVWVEGGGGIRCGKLFMRKNSKIINNSSAGWGGGVCGDVYAYDSSEISHNKSSGRGGGVWGFFYARSGNSVKLSYNKADSSGGAVYGIDSGGAAHLFNYAGVSGGGVQGEFFLNGAIFIGNQAPKGAALATDKGSARSFVDYSYIFNPDTSGNRQVEIYLLESSLANTRGCWWGQGHSFSSLVHESSSADLITHSYVVPNWRLNRGRTPGLSDTLFPVQAALRYNTGTPLLAGSMPWLEGHFSSSLGTMSPALAPINAKDTVESMFRSFIAPPVSQPVDFLAYIDADTFRVRSIVWGRDTSKVLKDTTKDTTASLAQLQVPRAAVQVYPIPAREVLNVSGLVSGALCQLYDMSGRMVMQLSASSTELSIPLQGLAVGSYVLRITHPDAWVASTQVQKE